MPGKPRVPPVRYLSRERKGQGHLLVKRVERMQGAKEIAVNARRVDLEVDGALVWGGERGPRSAQAQRQREAARVGRRGQKGWGPI